MAYYLAAKISPILLFHIISIKKYKLKDSLINYYCISILFSLFLLTEVSLIKSDDDFLSKERENKIEIK